MRGISHQVVVDAGDHRFVFVAEEGRLAIRQEGADSPLCSLTVGNPTELASFFEGLRQVLQAVGTSTPLRPRDRERDARIQQARQRNAKAFAPWTPDADGELRRRYERGQSIPDIARTLSRSQRAIEMRLEKLGLLGSGKLLGY